MDAGNQGHQVSGVVDVVGTQFDIWETFRKCCPLLRDDGVFPRLLRLVLGVKEGREGEIVY